METGTRRENRLSQFSKRQAHPSVIGIGFGDSVVPIILNFL